MGNGREYKESGGFTEYLYYQVGETIVASNGVHGKVIMEYEDKEKYHSGLPQFSNTSEIYFKKNDITKEIEHKDRKVIPDLDWDHPHKDFLEDVVHMHPWRENKHGKWTRSGEVRYMTDEEINRYGVILQMAYPGVRLRPCLFRQSHSRLPSIAASTETVAAGGEVGMDRLTGVGARPAKMRQNFYTKNLHTALRLTIFVTLR